MTALVLILTCTIAGGVLGYVAFWLHQNWDLHVHGSPARVVVVFLSAAGISVFRGVLAGLIVGAALAVFAESAW
jgi:hypothetical protein